MIKMKVKIGDLKPNPFRDMDNYPLNKAKLEALKKSIESTGFWDNIVGRLMPNTLLECASTENPEDLFLIDENHEIVSISFSGGYPIYETSEMVDFGRGMHDEYLEKYGNGGVEIAYGHHRLTALKEVFGLDYEVEVPIKDLTDELMLKIMANENMEEWHSSAAIIDETVKATEKFLTKHNKLLLGKENYVKQKVIADFLGWDENRVGSSMRRIDAMNKGTVSKDDIKRMPSPKAASEFVRATRAADKAAKAVDLPEAETKKIKDDLVNEFADGRKSSTIEVTDRVRKAAKEKKKAENPTPKPDPKIEKGIITFEQYLKDITLRVESLQGDISGLNKFNEIIMDYTYDNWENRQMFELSLTSMKKTIDKLFTNLKQIKEEKNGRFNG